MKDRIEIYSVGLMIILFISSLTSFPFKILADLFFEIMSEIYYVLPTWLVELKYNIYHFLHSNWIYFNNNDRNFVACIHLILILIIVFFLNDYKRDEFIILIGYKLSLFFMPIIVLLEYAMKFPVWWILCEIIIELLAFLIFYNIHLILKKLKSQL